MLLPQPSAIEASDPLITILPPLPLCRAQLALMLEEGFSLPRHEGRNATLAERIGQYVMRRLGRLGLLTGTQVFRPSQFQSMVRNLSGPWCTY